MVRYCQYLKENQIGMGPGKEELLLLVAQRSTKQNRNPKALTKVISNNPRVKKLLNIGPQLEGDEVF